MKSDFKAVKAIQIIFGAIILSCCIFWGIYGIGINGLNLFFNNSKYASSLFKTTSSFSQIGHLILFNLKSPFNDKVNLTINKSDKV